MANVTRDGFTRREFVEIVRDLSDKGVSIADEDDAIEWLRWEREKKQVREMREMQKGVQS